MEASLSLVSDESSRLRVSLFRDGGLTRSHVTSFRGGLFNDGPIHYIHGPGQGERSPMIFPLETLK